jgi:hypothetical protein
MHASPAKRTIHAVSGSDSPVLAVILDLEKWVSERDYRGYDPYDAMRSKLLKVVPLPGKYAKIAWIQFFKKCPVNLRPLFLIPKGINPKGMGLFLSSYTDLYRATGERRWLDKAGGIANWLLQHSSSGYPGKSWGYNFDWQSRAFFVTAGTPTIVNTSFIGHGFLDLYETTRDKQWLDVCQQACEFIVKGLNHLDDGERLCFSYTPLDQTWVHNANLLGAGLLARTARLAGIREWDGFIDRSARYAVEHQHADGAWPYAETGYQGWIDSFHTGFNLMSLRHVLDYRKSDSVRKAIQIGDAYYAGKFFLEDGSPKYYHDRLYPIDIHSPAMAIRYFSGIDGYHELSRVVYRWMTANMRRKDGAFIFQINRRLTTRIPYIRWGQAWALYGLTSYLLNTKQHG